MRGEILSSVELFLPPAVIETCYNIERDAQARFRAVNSEEKTKSEITVEKQTDDSVRIHVIVVSLACLTEEELCEEVFYDIPDKENTRKPVTKGRRGPKRKAKPGLSKKLKKSPIKKKPLKVRPNEDVLQSTLSEAFPDQSTDVAVKGIGVVEDISITEATEKDKLIPVLPEVTSSCQEDTVRHNKTAKRGRGGRGRSWRGRWGTGRGAARQANNIEHLKQTETVSELTEPTHTNVSGASELGTEEKKDNLVELPRDEVIPVIDQPFETKSALEFGRGKRVRRNTDKSNQKDSESESTSVAPIRPKRKLVKQGKEDTNTAEVPLPSTGKVKERKPKCSQESSTAPVSLPKVNKAPRKTKGTSASEEPEINTVDQLKHGNKDISDSDGTRVSGNTVSDSFNVEPPIESTDKDSPVIHHKPKAGKGVTRAKRNTKSSLNIVVADKEQPSNTKHDNVSVQSKIAEVVSTEDSGKSSQNVKGVLRAGKRRGRKPALHNNAECKQSTPDQPLSDQSTSDQPLPDQSITDQPLPDQSITDQLLKDQGSSVKKIPEKESISQTEPDHVTPDVGAADHASLHLTISNQVRSSPALVCDTSQPGSMLLDSGIPTFPRRVKTKAQLKQKPSELAIYSDNDGDIPVHKRLKDADSADTEQQGFILKHAGKKSIQKPKTLARIWRTRKKSGFTHRKKSKPKHGKELNTCQSDKDTDVESASKVTVAESAEADNLELPTDIHNNQQDSQIHTPGVTIEETKEKEQTAPDVGQTQIEHTHKLPQKKRHTARLAAERKRAAVEQANATIEPLVGEVGPGVDSDTGRQTENCEQSPIDSVTTSQAKNGTAPQSNHGTDSQSNSGTGQTDTVILDVSLDLYNTCTDFNETSAIESLIQLSNASLSGTNQGKVQYTTERPAHANGLTGASAATPKDQGHTKNVRSISKKETDNATEDITEKVGKSEAFQDLVKIATGSKTDGSEGLDEGTRQVKRAYKREFKVQCHFCQVKVKDYGYLFRHVKKLHRDKGLEMKQHLEEIRPLMRTPCPICHKMVSSISNISSHIKQCHATKESAVLCPICKKTYKTTVSLRQHLRQCHQPQQHRFFCHLCSANFTEKRSLKEHINCSHETTQVFQCDDCGKSFLTKGRLRRHKYIHGDFRHRCTYCNKGFHLKDNMNKHIEIVHEKTQGKRFKCPHCDKKFTVKGNMTQHVMGVHLKQFQYTCPQCQTGFRRKKDMLSHMLKHGDVPPDSSMLGELDGDEDDDDHTEDDDDSTDTEDQSMLDNPWTGRGERTEIITGLSGSTEGGAGGKPHVIIISPISGYADS